MRKKIITILCVVGLWNYVATAEKTTDGFETRIAFGLTLNEGNTDASLMTSELTTESRTKRREITAGGEYLYGERNGEKNADRTRLYAGTKEFVSEPFFLSGDLAAKRDRIAEIDYRVISSVGAGYFFIDTDNVTLSVDTGPAYVWEKVSGGREDYLGARFAQLYRHRLNENARWWQSLEYVPELQSTVNYLLTGEAGIEAAVNSRISLRTVYRVAYDNEPAEDKRTTDHQLITSIVVSL